MKKVNLLIVGNLIFNKLELVGGGGGDLLVCNELKLNEYFDLNNAITIHGDLDIESLKVGDQIIVITNQIIQKGGGHGNR